jgi:hypothetical protein
MKGCFRKLKIRRFNLYQRLVMILLLTASALLMVNGCGDGRDLSSPEKALLGHWMTEDGNIEYYFSEDTFITVDHEREGKQEFEHRYVVLESDSEKNWLRTEVLSLEDAEIIEGQDAFYRDIAISQDGTFLYEGMSIVVTENGTEDAGLIEVPPTKWVYIDDKRAPSE